MNSVSCSFALNTNINSNKSNFYVHEQDQTRANDIYSTLMRANDIYSTWTRANDITVYTLSRLTGNDWEMTKNEWEILFMTFNNLNRPFSFAVHEQSLNEIF